MGKNLKIGMFSWESLHSIKVGGIAPHVSELAEALAEKGHSVHIFTRNHELEPYEKVNGVHYHRVDHSLDGGIVQQMDSMCDSMYSRFLDVTREYGKFDMLHVHDWHPFNVVSRIKHEFGIPFMVTYHSTEWGRNGNVHGDWWEAREISHREWKAGYESIKVISTSQQLTDEIKFLYQIPDEKISIVPNGIFHGKIKKDVDPGEVKKRLGIHPLAPVVLFIGRMSYQKGPDLLVEAIPKVLDHRWDTQFVFIGEGEMRPHCEYLANAQNVSDRCHFLGYADDETARDWFNACDILCIPSRNEPFGIVVLEGWDAERTIVATDAVQIIDNFVDGILVYKDPESISWGLNYVLDDLSNDTLRQAGKELIETKFNWHKIAEETVEAYNLDEENVWIHGTTLGRTKQFWWKIDSDLNLSISREFNSSNGNLKVDKLIMKDELSKLDDYMADDQWKGLSNNVEKLRNGTEKEGIGKFLYNELHWINKEAQLSSHIGSIFHQAGVWEYNGKKRGIQFRKVTDDWHMLMKSYYGECIKELDETEQYNSVDLK
ncbi:Glycosyltransferase involved in cell wall bisynthesis [Methanococcoides vulcani]|uniref:Glycosyltransferase involved in cell wall bisynthesis n=1 Tax=Methanococcoides vulcani TaxID=1353158 RepID=A0A1I0ALL2_9EURY|nr:Glycosyltransferase involved in cell wall bisynthesis [Methanococcoides vulcani]